MSINKGFVKQFLKCRTADAPVLATANSSPVLGDETERYCLSTSRLGILRKPGLFKWVYSEVPLSELADARIGEGVFKSDILLIKRDKSEILLRSIDNDDARDLYEGIRKAIFHLDG